MPPSPESVDWNLLAREEKKDSEDRHSESSEEAAPFSKAGLRCKDFGSLAEEFCDRGAFTVSSACFSTLSVLLPEMSE